MVKEVGACAPTQFIIFGATGDLFKKKIIHSLFDLYCSDVLPQQFQVVAFGRRPFSSETFRASIKSLLKENEKVAPFLQKVVYVEGEFTKEDSYAVLAQHLKDTDSLWKTCSNKLFYCAVPPEYYDTIFEHLFRSGLSKPCSDELGWTRVLVEKPFGKDLDHALLLEKKLQSLFKEEQIFRIDHYLAKETMQNILAFRFANPLFENLWKNNVLEQVEVIVSEKNDVSERGAFYDGVGALRDVAQNHALQMLALVLMDRPIKMDAQSLREARAKVLKALGKPVFVSLGQYVGYTQEPHVSPESSTETFFDIRTHVDKVPVRLCGGKAFEESKVEIRLNFGHRDETPDNILTFLIQPRQGIVLSVNVKKPGLSYETIPSEFSFFYDGEAIVGSKDAYTKVLYDAMLGDQTLFPSSEEIMASWEFIMPLIVSRNTEGLIRYQKGTSIETMIQ